MDLMTEQIESESTAKTEHVSNIELSQVGKKNLDEYDNIDDVLEDFMITPVFESTSIHTVIDNSFNADRYRSFNNLPMNDTNICNHNEIENIDIVVSDDDEDIKPQISVMKRTSNKLSTIKIDLNVIEITDSD